MKILQRRCLKITKKLEIDIASVDELFRIKTDKGKSETVVNMPIKDIENFPNHPFRVNNDEELQEMIESIKENGTIIHPVLVRPLENGKYEMISGHRRKLASELAGIDNIPAIVREMSRDEATILMVDSNIQRERILPSEKAFAYKMKLEAIKRQGNRTDLTSTQLVQKLSVEVIAEQNGESRETIRRYIRLTELIKEILDMVDLGKVAFSPAVEISYLTGDEQYVLLDCMNRYEATPSQAQAIHLKKLSQEGILTSEKIEDIISEEKANQKMKYNIHYERFEKYIPRDVVTPKEVEDFLFKCVEEHHHRVLQKKRVLER